VKREKEEKRGRTEGVTAFFLSDSLKGKKREKKKGGERASRIIKISLSLMGGEGKGREGSRIKSQLEGKKKERKADRFFRLLFLYRCHARKREKRRRKKGGASLYTIFSREREKKKKKKRKKEA